MLSRFLLAAYDECGVGFSYRGVHRGRHPDQRIATLWFCFLLLPLFPVLRAQFHWDQENWVYQRRLKLKPSAVVKTYFWGLLVAPVAFLGPCFFCIREVYQSLHGPPGLHVPLTILAVGWLAFGMWRVLKHQNRDWTNC